MTCRVPTRWSSWRTRRSAPPVGNVSCSDVSTPSSGGPASPNSPTSTSPAQWPSSNERRPSRRLGRRPDDTHRPDDTPRTSGPHCGTTRACSVRWTSAGGGRSRIVSTAHGLGRGRTPHRAALPGDRRREHRARHAVGLQPHRRGTRGSPDRGAAHARGRGDRNRGGRAARRPRHRRVPVQRCCQRPSGLSGSGVADVPRCRHPRRTTPVRRCDHRVARSRIHPHVRSAGGAMGAPIRQGVRAARSQRRRGRSPRIRGDRLLRNHSRRRRAQGQARHDRAGRTHIAGVLAACPSADLVLLDRALPGPRPAAPAGPCATTGGARIGLAADGRPRRQRR